MLLKRALNMREGHGRAVKPHVQTVVLLASQTKLADPAWPGWRDRNKITCRKTAHPIPQLRNASSHLMPQNHRLFEAHRAKSAMVVVMQIRPANSRSS